MKGAVYLDSLQTLIRLLVGGEIVLELIDTDEWKDRQICWVRLVSGAHIGWNRLATYCDTHLRARKAAARPGDSGCWAAFGENWLEIEQ